MAYLRVECISTTCLSIYTIPAFVNKLIEQSSPTLQFARRELVFSDAPHSTI